MGKRKVDIRETCEDLASELVNLSDALNTAIASIIMLKGTLRAICQHPKEYYITNGQDSFICGLCEGEICIEDKNA
jgi:hypothetical protein